MGGRRIFTLKILEENYPDRSLICVTGVPRDTEIFFIGRNSNGYWLRTELGMQFVYQVNHAAEWEGSLVAMSLANIFQEYSAIHPRRNLEDGHYPVYVPTASIAANFQEEDFESLLPKVVLTDSTKDSKNKHRLSIDATKIGPGTKDFLWVTDSVPGGAKHLLPSEERASKAKKEVLDSLQEEVWHCEPTERALPCHLKGRYSYSIREQGATVSHGPRPSTKDWNDEQIRKFSAYGSSQSWDRLRAWASFKPYRGFVWFPTTDTPRGQTSGREVTNVVPLVFHGEDKDWKESYEKKSGGAGTQYFCKYPKCGYSSKNTAQWCDHIRRDHCWIGLRCPRCGCVFDNYENATGHENRWQRGEATCAVSCWWEYQQNGTPPSGAVIVIHKDPRIYRAARSLGASAPTRIVPYYFNGQQPSEIRGTDRRKGRKERERQD